MKTGIRGIALIKRFESLRTEAYAATEHEREQGIWTIGYGCTTGVREGDSCTAVEAENYLYRDLERFERAVLAAVRVQLTQSQFDAMVSLCFNIGAEAFAKSTLVKFLNAGDYTQAANQFLRWNKQAGKVLKGLVLRREAEKALFERAA